MSKTKRIYGCEACGAQHLKWQGQCPDCGAWNSLSERQPRPERATMAHYAAASELTRLDRLGTTEIDRIATGFRELDRVLGGGLVPGSVVLIGGDPGIGKSTLLLSALAAAASSGSACYVTGEESLAQTGLRAKRLGVADAPLELLAETCVEAILAQLESSPPAVLVIDSIQTLFSEAVASAPGTVSQLRESAAQLVRFAKSRNVATFLVGHVTKEGTLAGPRVLEHMVDTVLYFESDAGSRFRIIRAVKNRFGAANELGFFAMDESGFREVSNPSAIFLSRAATAVPGSITLVTRESTRPVLVEVQALVDAGAGGTTPRRVAQGLDAQRLGMLLAVLHRHCGIAVGDQDVFANVVGGLRVTETAADVALSLAIVSSLRERALSRDLAVFGEIGLTGEIRPVPFGEERVAEAAKHGFTRVLLPKANQPRQPRGIEVIAAERLSDALAAAFG
jgi:DNA repair protein RadA/Sms